MKKFKTTLFSTIFIFILTSKVFALNNTGPATEYKITMTHLELCEVGSTDSNCLNPVTIGTGVSAPIDIANTSAGAAAASYGKLGSVPFGKSYGMYQVTMKRAITIAGTVSDGTNTCRTNADDSTINTAVKGKTSGAAATVTLYIAFVSTTLDKAINSIDSGDGSGTAQAAGTVAEDDEYVQYRGVFTQPVKLTGGRLPTLKLAFGTANALGYMSAANGRCASHNGSTSQGLYGDKPNVTATVIY
tara:strand:+ start:987 stop:1721 length:735 start_codon:yes stop_codon:yes gene_type:complete